MTRYQAKALGRTNRRNEDLDHPGDIADLQVLEGQKRLVDPDLVVVANTKRPPISKWGQIHAVCPAAKGVEEQQPHTSINPKETRRKSPRHNLVTKEGLGARVSPTLGACGSACCDESDSATLHPPFPGSRHL